MNLAFGMPGPIEIIAITGLLVLIFGATRLPKLARSMGSSLTQFKLGLREANNELAKLEAQGEAEVEEIRRSKAELEDHVEEATK